MPDTARAAVCRGYAEVSTREDHYIPNKHDGKQPLYSPHALEHEDLFADIDARNHNDFGDLMSHRMAWFTFFCFVFATGVLLVLLSFGEETGFCENTLVVVGVAMVAYLFKAFHMAEYTVFGVAIPVVRYVDWILTTPFMLKEVAELGGADWAVATFLIVCDLFMLLFGLVAIFVTKDKKVFCANYCFIASCAFFGCMLIPIHVTIADGTAMQQPPHVRELFHQLKWLTSISWSFYPLVVYLGRAHINVLSPAQEDIALMAMDVISKIGMEGLIIATCAQKDAQCHGANG